MLTMLLPCRLSESMLGLYYTHYLQCNNQTGGKKAYYETNYVAFENHIIHTTVHASRYLHPRT
jgi:hypothetical protein